MENKQLDKKIYTHHNKGKMMYKITDKPFLNAWTSVTQNNDLARV